MKCEKVIGLVFLFVCIGLNTCAYAVNLSSPMTFSHYQSFIVHQETGVYEWKGLLFAVSKRPLGTAMIDRKRARADATVEITRLLYQWALEQTKENRKSINELPSHLQYIKKIVEKYNPFWLCDEWSIRTQTREFPERFEHGTYLLCQAFDIDKLRGTFPALLTREIGEESLLSALKKVIKAKLNGNGKDRGFFADLGAYDNLEHLSEVDYKTGKAGAEYVSFQKKLQEFLVNSKIAVQFKDSAIKNKGPRILFQRKMSEDNSTEETTNQSEYKTNFLSSVVSSTNIVVRSQTEKEIRDTGVSAGCSVKDVSVDSHIAMVVKTEVKTITTITTYRLHDVVNHTYGQPVFEELFLTGGCTNIISAKQTEEGKVAKQIFYNNSSLEEKEFCIRRALSENPFDKELWNLLGRCFQEKNEDIAAIICFRLALRLDCGYPFAWTNLARSYLEMGYTLTGKGAAMIAFALTDDDWCVRHAKKILLEDVK